MGGNAVSGGMRVTRKRHIKFPHRMERRDGNNTDEREKCRGCNEWQDQSIRFTAIVTTDNSTQSKEWEAMP
jgi:hypothetical protein